MLHILLSVDTSEDVKQLVAGIVLHSEVSFSVDILCLAVDLEVEVRNGKLLF